MQKCVLVRTDISNFREELISKEPCVDKNNYSSSKVSTPNGERSFSRNPISQTSNFSHKRRTRRFMVPKGFSLFSFCAKVKTTSKIPTALTYGFCAHPKHLQHVGFVCFLLFPLRKKTAETSRRATSAVTAAVAAARRATSTTLNFC